MREGGAAAGPSAGHAPSATTGARDTAVVGAALRRRTHRAGDTLYAASAGDVPRLAPGGGAAARTRDGGARRRAAGGQRRAHGEDSGDDQRKSHDPPPVTRLYWVFVRRPRSG